jgi:hypothetical protein
MGAVIMSHGSHEYKYSNVYQFQNRKVNTKQVTEDMFAQATGFPPTQDDLERCNCSDTGRIGHFQCGWCRAHKKPRFVCGCIYVKSSV